MKLNEDYNLETDGDKNYILMKKFQKTNKVNGKIVYIDEYDYKPHGFYGTLESALRDFARKEILGTGLKDLETVQKKFDELFEVIHKVCK